MKFYEIALFHVKHLQFSPQLSRFSVLPFFTIYKAHGIARRAAYCFQAEAQSLYNKYRKKIVVFRPTVDKRGKICYNSIRKNTDRKTVARKGFLT